MKKIILLSQEVEVWRRDVADRSKKPDNENCGAAE
jgi:hypothetical protein